MTTHNHAANYHINEPVGPLNDGIQRVPHRVSLQSHQIMGVIFLSDEEYSDILNDAVSITDTQILVSSFTFIQGDFLRMFTKECLENLRGYESGPFNYEAGFISLWVSIEPVSL